jgi:hypothetical protein
MTNIMLFVFMVHYAGLMCSLPNDLNLDQSKISPLAIKKILKISSCCRSNGLVVVMEIVFSFFFIYLVREAIGTAATRDLLWQPRVTVKMIVEKQMECRWVEETEVLGENLPQRHFCPSQNPT